MLKHTFNLLLFTAILVLMSLFGVHLLADVGVTAHNSTKNITVLIIDTGIDQYHDLLHNRVITCPHPEDCVDFFGHGTHVASLVLNGPLDKHNKPTNQVCNRVVVHSCDYKPNTGFRAAYNECLEYARWLKPDFINFSSAGSTFLKEEYDTYAQLTNTAIVVAAGNEGENLYDTPSFPAIFPKIAQIAPNFAVPNLSNVITVSAKTSEGTRYMSSNYADFTVSELGVNVLSAAPGNTYEVRSGTSMAAAIHTNKLLKAKCDEQ